MTSPFLSDDTAAGLAVPNRGDTLVLSMFAPARDRAFHVISFSNRVEAQAFGAALRRFLSGPEGSVFQATGGLTEIWSSPPASGAVELYLSDTAVEAARKAFSPVPVAGMRLGRDLPAGCIWMSAESIGESRAVSGRPLEGEFADYAGPDIDQVQGDDAVEILSAQERSTLALLAPLDEDRIKGLTYAPGKWTLKEVVGHLADDERSFAYRALHIARADDRPLFGFDEKMYVQAAGSERRSLGELLLEYRAVRQASLTFFNSLTQEAWLRKGRVNDYEASVRGLAFHIAGHELRHIRSLEEKYLPRIR